MNKTLLLIICDFLLLNLLALTRWETIDPVRDAAPVPEIAANTTQNQDLLEAMKLSLQDERAAREQLVEQLQSARSNLQTREELLRERDQTLRQRDQVLKQREQDLNALQNQKGELEKNLVTTRGNVDQLTRSLSAATQSATATKEQLERLQRELESRRQEMEKQQLALSELEKQKAAAEKEVSSLNVAYKVAEAEKNLLASNLTQMKGEVETVRQEKTRIQQQAELLARGVGQLAEKSSELTQEIRENRPINANTLFNEFLSNRVQTIVSATRPGLLGPVHRSKETQTALITDGQQTFAVIHVLETPFDYSEFGADWDRVTAGMFTSAKALAVPQLHFLARDSRVLILPVSAENAAALKVKAYQLAADPFKFSEAVLISRGGKYYGETEFKLDPKTPHFVKMKNRLTNRIFGEFSPQTGDLVLSKTGEVLGIMVNPEYCVVLNQLTASRTLQLGENLGPQRTGRLFEEMRLQATQLPLWLQ